MSKSAKEHFRSYCLNRLRFLVKNKNKKDKYICSSILSIINLYSPRNILLYIPLSMEVDVKPLINVLRKEKNISLCSLYHWGIICSCKVQASSSKREV